MQKEPSDGGKLERVELICVEGAAGERGDSESLVKSPTHVFTTAQRKLEAQQREIFQQQGLLFKYL